MYCVIQDAGVKTEFKKMLFLKVTALKSKVTLYAFEKTIRITKNIKYYRNLK